MKFRPIAFNQSSQLHRHKDESNTDTGGTKFTFSCTLSFCRGHLVEVTSLGQILDQ